MAARVATNDFAILPKSGARTPRITRSIGMFPKIQLKTLPTMAINSPDGSAAVPRIDGTEPITVYGA